MKIFTSGVQAKFSTERMGTGTRDMIRKCLTANSQKHSLPRFTRPRFRLGPGLRCRLLRALTAGEPATQRFGRLGRTTLGNDSLNTNIFVKSWPVNPLTIPD